MTTLSDLKQYCQDNAGEASSTKADRVFLRLINDALREVRAGHNWSRFRRVAHVPLDVAVAGTDVSVSSGGSTLTFGSGEVAVDKYLNTTGNEKWGIRLDADTLIAFRIDSHASSTASLADNEEWVGSAVTSGAYTWFRDHYTLPESAVRIMRAELHNSQDVLSYMLPHEFDAYMIDRIADLEEEPEVITLRGDTIQVWPPLSASATRQVMIVSYEAVQQVFTSATSDATVIDWETQWEDLLHRAIDVEIASQIPQSCHMDVGTAHSRYRQRLRVYKGLDGGEYLRRRSMGLSLNVGPRKASFRTNVGADGNITS